MRASAEHGRDSSPSNTGNHVVEALFKGLSRRVADQVAPQPERMRCTVEDVFFPKALRRVLPENLLNTYTSTLTLEHVYTYT